MRLKGKKVLVTGACGFIGSHLVERLADEGCDIRAFVFYNSLNSWGWLDAVGKKTLAKIEVVTGDIRDPNGVRNAVKGCNVVFHLAALIGIPFSYNFPDTYVDTNIKGTLNILHACREHKVEKIVVTSTSEVYGTAKYVPIDEKHPLQGQSPYSATKIGADKISEAFYLSFNVPVVIARPFNTYGPRQSARAVIPTIISQILSDAKTVKLGSTYPTRDMNYVQDVCNAFVRIAESDKVLGRVVNICSSNEISVGDLTRLILGLMGSDKKIAKDTNRVRPNKSEVGRLFGDNRLIHSLTGWKPRYSLEEGITETIEWFKVKDNMRLYKPEIYNV